MSALKSYHVAKFFRTRWSEIAHKGHHSPVRLTLSRQAKIGLWRNGNKKPRVAAGKRSLFVAAAIEGFAFRLNVKQ